MTNSTSWSPKPARGYSWPSFEKGHTLSVQGGAWSRRIADARAEDILAQVRPVLPDYLQAPAFTPSLVAWAVAEAKVELLSARLEETGYFREDGEPRRMLEELRHWTRRASEERDRLGLSPLARARLGRDVAAQNFDVARYWAELSKQDQTSAASVPTEGTPHDVDHRPRP